MLTQSGISSSTGFLINDKVHTRNGLFIKLFSHIISGLRLGWNQQKLDIEFDIYQYIWKYQISGHSNRKQNVYTDFRTYTVYSVGLPDVQQDASFDIWPDTWHKKDLISGKSLVLTRAGPASSAQWRAGSSRRGSLPGRRTTRPSNKSLLRDSSSKL